MQELSRLDCLKVSAADGREGDEKEGGALFPTVRSRHIDLGGIMGDNNNVVIYLSDNGMFDPNLLFCDDYC